eukprot:TRINITY_DN78966_c0_g1_i1.p1 TRINITY_DN78966_c0_g1~~TRINITY_DN78966_c0_g1_i1.p1  ORF type:complete len:606 (-),score=166.24 TRINITY_DN78966_c0_g1_i1:181-1929(-)
MAEAMGATTASGFARPPRPAMDEARRQKLATIQEREAMKDQLIYKYRDKFKNKPKQADEVSITSGIIRREVDRFIGSAAPMTEANLARLEKRLEKAGEGHSPHALKPIDYDKGSAMSVSEYTVGSTPAVSNRARSVGSAGSVRKVPLSARQTTPVRPRPAQALGGAASGSLSARVATPLAVTGANVNGSGPSAQVGDAAYTAAAVLSIGNAASNGAVAESNFNPLSPRHGGDTNLEWAVLDKLAAQLHKQDAVKQKSKEQELKQRLRHDLDRQLADNKLQEERAKAMEEKYGELEADRNKKWSEQVKVQDEERRLKVLKQRDDQQAQIALVKARQEEEKLRELQEAKEMMDRVGKEAENDKRAAEERHRMRFQQAQEALKESNAALRMREERTQMIEFKERESLQAYEKMQAQRKEGKSQNAMKDESRRHQLNDIAMARVQQDREKIEASALRADLERIERDRTVEAREKANREKLEAERRRNQEYILSQVKEKHLRKTMESEKKREHQSNQEMESRRVEAMEKDKDARRRRNNHEHRMELERQIAAKALKATGGTKEVMSECELRLNKSLLEKVTLALTDL